MFQVQGRKRRRALCFLSSKRQLLLEKNKNRTGVKISKYNLAKDRETIYTNDMTYISKPRPEEYSFQFEETASMFNQWVSLKEAIEHCEPMALVNIRAKVVDVVETETASQKKLKMPAESIISDGETTASLVLWEKDVSAVQKGKAFNFQQVRVKLGKDKKIFNTTKNTVITVNSDASLNNIETVETTLERNIKTINVSKIEFIEQYHVSKTCVNCNKHIMQNNSEYVLKCDFCNYVMRHECTKLSAIVKIVVQDPSLEDLSNNTVHLTVFHNTIVKLLKTEDIYDEDFVCCSLLKLNDLKVTYNTKRNIVVDIEEF